MPPEQKQRKGKRMSKIKCMEVLSLCSTWGDDQSGLTVSCQREINHEGMHRAATEKEVSVFKADGHPGYEYKDVDIHWKSTDNSLPPGEKEKQDVLDDAENGPVPGFSDEYEPIPFSLTDNPPPQGGERKINESKTK